MRVRLNKWRSWMLAASVAASTGACTVRAGGQDAGPTSQSVTRLTLSYTRTTSGAAGATTDAPRFDAQGSFVRYEDLAPTALAAILGMTDLSAPVGSCRVVDGTADLDEALAPANLPRGARVSLLDAGRLELRGPAGKAAFNAHPYPDVLPFVSGMVYGSEGTDEEAQIASLSLGQPYAVVGDGGEDVEPFTAVVSAPRAFPALTVEPLRKGGDVELHWSAGELNDEPLLVEIKWSAKSASRTVRCRVRDDGSFVVGHETFEPLPGATSTATVTATRLVRTPVSVAGGTGDLVLELREVAPLAMATNQ